MDINKIEKLFCAYLERHGNLSDLRPFLLTYIDLLLLFKRELSELEMSVVLERKKQLRHENFNECNFERFRKAISNAMSGHLKGNTSTSRDGMINRLLFCALLDTEENDFFYLTEPIFEFVGIMKVSSVQLSEILENQFADFRCVN
jgi:hypothetical protein